ncbi:hypothetical protein HPB52_005577 [Rhipicephalus sanguineus]|uniref:Neurogenic mastermind-like N-terminal domain-containing protein n=1 Tax=Rhipicephalus sanguineus TaxID=34632 RepID=A0A9D4Q550_RHISA|nr:hypothetical protein HPB52_005577 [Rhipicephalus sanguineus]
MRGDVLPPKRQAVVDRLRRRIELYRRHHNATLPRYEQAANAVYEEQRQETLLLKQRYLESKAKKSKKSEHKSLKDSSGAAATSSADSHKNILQFMEANQLTRPPSSSPTDVKSFRLHYSQNKSSIVPQHHLQHYTARVQNPMGLQGLPQQGPLRVARPSVPVASNQLPSHPQQYVQRMAARQPTSMSSVPFQNPGSLGFGTSRMPLPVRASSPQQMSGPIRHSLSAASVTAQSRVVFSTAQPGSAPRPPPFQPPQLSMQPQQATTSTLPPLPQLQIPPRSTAPQTSTFSPSFSSSISDFNLEFLESIENSDSDLLNFDPVNSNFGILDDVLGGK